MMRNEKEFPFKPRQWAWLRYLLGRDGLPEHQWGRVVMRQRTRAWVGEMNPGRLKVLEISGNDWRSFGFRSYREAWFPDYDVCLGPLNEKFDLIIAEQVFEHLLWPLRAIRHVHEMLVDGGYFLITLPFLVKIHGHPIDCSRWTPLGLKHMLAEGGFPLESIRTDLWGNRACARAMMGRWTPYVRLLHSLKNEPDFPVHVWALARKNGQL